MSLAKMPEPDRGVIARSSAIVQDLEQLIGADAVISDEEGRRTFEADALTAYRRVPLAVVLPRSTEEVAKVLNYCHQNRIKVVPRGAGTSLCGGALPAEDAIVIGISRMNRVLETDFVNRTIRAETGITNLAVTEAVAAEGFFYAPDPSSQLACTIGGNLAMNSGGAHCLKYGVTTNNVLGLRIVLMDGEIVEIGGPQLDAEGYDLLALIVGSEGQFGIVTEATLRILPARPRPRVRSCWGFPRAKPPASASRRSSARGSSPSRSSSWTSRRSRWRRLTPRPAIRSTWRRCSSSRWRAPRRRSPACSPTSWRSPRPSIRASSRPARRLSTAQRIWKGRKAAFGAMGRISDYYCMDGTIPLSRLAEVLGAIAQICTAHRLKVANVFHAGDGNLHPLILYNANDADEALRAELAGAEILKLCVAVGGCLTGEHGVGIEKRELMSVQFSDADLAVQMRIKSVFDPLWLLNPGKVFPIEAARPAAQAAQAASSGAGGGSVGRGGLEEIWP